MRTILLAAVLTTGCGAPRGAEGAPSMPTFYVADLGAGEVLRIDSLGGVEVIVDADSLPEPGALQPSSVVIDGEALIVSDFASGDVSWFDRRSGAWLGDLHTNSSDADAPRMEEPADARLLGDRVAVLGNDTRNLLVLDRDRGAIGELGGAEASPNIRYGHSFDVLGPRMFVATSAVTRDEGLIQEWDLSTGERLGDFAPPGEMEEGTALRVGPDGLLYVADWFGDQLLRYDPDDGALLDQLLGPEVLDDPIAMAFDDDGSLYVLGAHGICALAPDGAVWTAPSPPLDWPRGLAIATD